MKINKLLPLTLSTICFCGGMTITNFQPHKSLSVKASTIKFDRVNGYNVKQVNYNGGFFQQQVDGSWVEKNRDGQFAFKETHRDQWSVYLLKSDGLRIQLDLHRKEVIWSGKGKLYTIKSSFNLVRNPIASKINGYSVNRVVYGPKKGYFQKHANGSWVETNKDGQFTFKEVARDEWSVYLVKSNGLRIQLDLHRKEVIWMGQGKLYDIQKFFY